MASEWVVRLLAGPLATAVAVLAVSVVGLMMLTGRIRWWRGAEVAVGIFVIFGAPALVVGLLERSTPDLEEAEATAPTPKVTVQPPAPSVYDPYAGASVPAAHSPSDLMAPRP